MEDNEYGIKNGNALDRIAHALHMQETWANTVKFFKKLKKEKPSKSLCSCLDQVYGDWITKSLLYITKQIREPEQMYTNTAESNGKRKQFIPYYSYRCHFDDGCCIPWYPIIRDQTIGPLTLRPQIRGKVVKEEAIPNCIENVLVRV